ncbi:ecdysone-induced protein 75B-like [Drosophila takahashii]|uniref:ecdysone-induced protein 75B-like n=1 Tax=Drosophila takahashii TaxID=29030 RepID=UPI0038991A4B
MTPPPPPPPPPPALFHQQHFCQDCLSSPSPPPTIITEQAQVHAMPGLTNPQPHIEHCSCGLSFSVVQDQQDQQDRRLEQLSGCQHHHHPLSPLYHLPQSSQNAHAQTDFSYAQR